jgi:hypothetical protein
MDYCYRFPVVKGIQAGRDYYIGMVPLKMLSKLFPTDEEYVLPEYRAQRRLNESRIPEIKNYIIKNEDNYVFSALAASIDGDFDFIESNQDYDIVCMVNDYKHDGIIQKIGKHTFYKIMRRASRQEYVAGASDFRLMKRNVVKSLVSMHETNRFTKGLFSYVGYKTHYIKYTPDKRIHGASKFKLKKQVSYAIDGILNFSTLPLRFASVIGGVISCGAFIYFIVLLIKTLVQGKDIPGYASLMSILLILGGLILFVLGIIGEYVSRTYIEIKNRPIYIVKEKIGYDEDIL